MKYILYVFACIVLAQQIAAQGYEKPHAIGLGYSLNTDTDVFKFTSLTGAASYSVEKSLVLGIAYLYDFNDVWTFEAGLEYSKHDLLIHPAFDPQRDNTPRKTTMGLLSIPITMRCNLWKYFFINGGALVDVEVDEPESVDDQTGLGAILGLGVKYEFNSGTSVFVNPFIKAHALLPFSKENYHDHLMESGFRFGITQRL